MSQSRVLCFSSLFKLDANFPPSSIALILVSRPLHFRRPLRCGLDTRTLFLDFDPVPLPDLLRNPPARRWFRPRCMKNIPLTGRLHSRRGLFFPCLNPVLWRLFLLSGSPASPSFPQWCSWSCSVSPPPPPLPPLRDLDTWWSNSFVVPLSHVLLAICGVILFREAQVCDTRFTPVCTHACTFLCASEFLLTI